MPSTEPPVTDTSASGPAARGVPEVPPARPAGEQAGVTAERKAALPGYTLQVRRRLPSRDGLPPALYVHGLGGSSFNWTALADQLAGRVDGEAIDLPGFGHSPPPDDGDYSIAGHARAVIRYIEHSGRGPVHLFGNSMGGAVTTRVAALRPDLVRTLTLVSPALPERRPQRSAVPTALLAMPGVSGLWARYTSQWSVAQYVNGVLHLCYGDTRRVTSDVYEASLREAEYRKTLPYHWDAMERSARGVVSAYTLTGQHSLWRQAQRVLAPTLLVYGGRDQLVAPRMARKAARTFPDSRLLFLPEAGHVAMMEYPAIVARAFSELLDGAGETEADGETLTEAEGTSESGSSRVGS
ncbi:alpha/beta hydrolase [Streptomyces sp. A7024]|uniref:Alpha/beta hydrolase n=1 Tax=Streptomyces coryli TaxID=1128680 RepID=A0A6G4UE96_9ACTN|nr:alpha/beta hydrolase [Streptomyces coryli]NGN70100.1 alpha/beta hydrolase [Streptomyces coryli]